VTDASCPSQAVERGNLKVLSFLLDAGAMLDYAGGL